jgi:hypothetical protein
MFSVNKKFLISPEMAKYIRDSTNKSIEKHLDKYKINSQSNINDVHNLIGLLPFVSFISFLAGYNLYLLAK